MLDLLSERGETSLSAARKALGTSLTTVVPALEEAGLLQRVYRISSKRPAARQEQWIRLLTPPSPEELRRVPAQAAIIATLQHRARLAPDGADGFALASEILGQSGASRSALTALVGKGIVEEVSRGTGSLLTGAGRPGGAVPELTPAQAAAWATIELALQARA